MRSENNQLSLAINKITSPSGSKPSSNSHFTRNQSQSPGSGLRGPMSCAPPLFSLTSSLTLPLLSPLKPQGTPPLYLKTHQAHSTQGPSHGPFSHFRVCSRDTSLLLLFFTFSITGFFLKNIHLTTFHRCKPPSHQHSPAL